MRYEKKTLKDLQSEGLSVEAVAGLRVDIYSANDNTEGDHFLYKMRGGDKFAQRFDIRSTKDVKVGRTYYDGNNGDKWQVVGVDNSRDTVYQFLSYNHGQGFYVLTINE